MAKSPISLVKSAGASTATSPLPPQPISTDVLLEKYAKGDERDVADVRRRVALALAQVEETASRARWAERFEQALEQGFIPAGRIQSAAGSGLEATLVNCFVQPVGDAIATPEDGHPGIYTALAEAAETMRRGGGVGYDFSRIRPRGAWVHSTQSHASGPVSYLRVFDRSCETVESAGARRGAQMGVLRVDHPDIEDFVHAKDSGDLRNFNLSVGITDAFMEAVQADAEFALVHRAEPSPQQKAQGAYARQDADGSTQWVYRTLPARALWDQIMRSTYDHAEPGVLFLDTLNRDNNLAYCETLHATNPCGEQPLPAYGCCCLGSIDLTRFVQRPFEPEARFDEAGFAALARVAVRMLDNVLDLTLWPLPQQADEARAKRRVGLGFTGLGDALVMLGLRYDTPEARTAARHIAETMRDAAYDASVELARERGPFPLFNAHLFLAGHGFASRLPAGLRERIRSHGLRNSHLLSIAPTGTISLAFADNASNGIEPAFSWTYTRKKRLADGRWQEYAVEDHAWRLYRHLAGADAPLTAAFVTALEMSAEAHAAMVAAVAPFVDTAISKTVNVPADYPYAEFQDLYFKAWEMGLKGLATYRPNAVLGAVLSTTPAAAPAPMPLPDANRRLALDKPPTPVLASLRWPGRPELPAGNPAWTFMVHHPHGERRTFPGVVAALAAVIRWRCEQLGALPRLSAPQATPVVDALFSLQEPETGPSGTLAWAVDIDNAATGEAFTLTLKEVTLPGPDGQPVTRPCAMALAGHYPRALDGLSRVLSLDMRVVDPAWIGMKLRKLLNYAEPLGHFMAFVPGERRQQTWPSTVAYMARLIIHRYAMLGVLDERGFPLREMGVLESPRPGAMPLQAGRPCPECGNASVIHKDGCDFCTACGYVGMCG